MKFAALLFSIILLSAGFGKAQRVSQERLRLKAGSCNYFVMQPGDSIRGIVFIFPGRGEQPKSVFRKTALFSMLSQKGYLVIVPELHYSLFADELILSQLEAIGKIQSEKYKLVDPFVTVGGFSAGGAVAISYAENILSGASHVNLKSVFVIDPPLDLENMHKRAERLLSYDCGNLIHNDGAYTKKYLEETFGGPPSSSPGNYITYSPFLASQQDGGNAKWLTSVPLRIYTEPDVDFVKQKYCSKLVLEDLNAPDLEKLFKLLQEAGNKNAELIVTSGKGYHNWLIADPAELTDWIIKFGK